MGTVKQDLKKAMTAILERFLHEPVCRMASNSKDVFLHIEITESGDVVVTRGRAEFSDTEWRDQRPELLCTLVHVGIGSDEAEIAAKRAAKNLVNKLTGNGE